MQKQRVTRKFIAEKAGVSPSTVSYVVNHPHLKKISEATKKHVSKIIKKYNYFPNSAAKSLVGSKTFNIGFLTNYPLKSFLADPFQNEIFAGITSEIEENEYGMLFSLLKKVELETTDDINFSVKKMVLGNVVDGMILFGKFDKKLIRFVSDHNIKFVLIDYYLKDMKVNAVLPDNIKGAYEAVEYLIKKGLKKIYCINGDIYHPSYTERPQGYRRAMNDNDLKPIVFNKKVIHGGIYEFISELIQKKDLPEAFFATGDFIAMETLHALRNHKIKVPQQIKIMGFDNCYYSESNLTTVHIQKEEMGREAVKLLLKKIQGEKSPSLIRLPTRLIIRETA